MTSNKINILNKLKVLSKTLFFPEEERLKKIELARKYILNQLFFLLLFIIIIIVFIELRKNLILIEPVESPKKLQEFGYTGTVLSNKLIDKILEIYNSASTNVQLNDISTLSQYQKYDIKVPESGLSLISLIDYFRIVLGIRPKRLLSEIIMIDNTIMITTRLSNEPSYCYKVVYDSSDIVEAIDGLLTNSAKYFFIYTQPYIYASHLWKNNDIDGLKKIMEYIITRENKQYYDDWAYYYLGKIHENNNDIDDAIKMYKKSFTLNPEYIPPYYALASIYINNKDIMSAIELYEKIITINNNLTEIHLQLGKIYFDKNNYKKATYHYKTAIDIENQPIEIYLDLSYAYMKLKNYELAIITLKKAITYYPEAEKLYIKLIDLVLYKKDYVDAINIINIALNNNCKNKVLYLHMGKLQYIKGNNEQAEKNLLNAINIDSSYAEAYLYLGIVARTDFKKIPKSNEYFKKTIRFDKSPESYLTKKAQKYLDANQ